jgi:hypothetical protein
MTHLYVKVSSDQAYRFLKAVAKWSGVYFDETTVIPDKTEFEVINDMAEKIIAKQFTRARSSVKLFDSDISPEIQSNVYDTSGQPTNFACRSIKDYYFHDGTNFLLGHPDENSHVVYNKCIDFVYVVKRLGPNSFEWATYFI